MKEQIEILRRALLMTQAELLKALERIEKLEAKAGNDKHEAAA